MSLMPFFYDKNAVSLAKYYDSVEFESVHHSCRTYWPRSGSFVLDVGAGTGRDARWFHKQGCSVVAVEPSSGMRQLGIENSAKEINWINDSLPDLTSVVRLENLYDFILLSGVWMHLPTSNRAAAFKTLSDLLSDNGILVITLRHGSFHDEREHFDVSVSELENLCLSSCLSICQVTEQTDMLKRHDITWQTVVLKKIA
ncbi:class I SAM-dependent methyltransferase [Vibrio proteolyticus]|uniref:Methyltransferase domain-containing protein n=1 Tax=Vibrio proteolyticus NBRC 13287 TaxID=1219065 RepID=U2ZWB3_VIBPR|nr:class I SAM-dependent methyltransferase [Vibrio proteolyticus]GAD65730.1 hypothetical protein VPR01S_01_05040 [Vibrio proteolyticus NBRC 13287]